MKTIEYLLYFAAAAFILSSCIKKQEPAQQDSNLIEVTYQQFTNDAMQLGEIETRTFENTLKCNGTIVPLPNGIAKVNALVGGIIRGITCHNGQFVEKNQLLFEITGNEIIDLQKEFTEASANYKRTKNDYQRIKSLYDEKVTSEKDFILAETEFRVSFAKYNGLRLKIETTGLPVSEIENGEFFPSYSVKSPIRGYITRLNANIGSYLDSQTELLEIINPDMFQIRLSVFASDIKQVKKGQYVRYKSLNSVDINPATISSVGAAIDNETKTIECYASITQKKTTNPLANEFVESEIVIRTDTVKALPNDALIKNETGYVLLLLEKQENDTYYLKPIDINIGRQYNGYTEILTKDIHGKILIKGAYNLF